MLIVNATPTTFELPPAGPIAARCLRLIDLGTQQTEYQGTTKPQRKILISWELAETRTDGEPFTISRRFGLSLHEKSALRGFLEAWRGRPFSSEELSGFDLRRLLNAPCLLNLVHIERAGKSYANIASVSPLPNGMTAPELKNPPVVFDLDDPGTFQAFESLSESLQATIASSPEWKARKRNESAETVGTDDDIPW